MRKVCQSLILVVGTAVGLPVCWAQLQSPLRIHKAPAPIATSNITADDLNRLAAEQNRVLEKQNPCLAMAKTNKTFAQAMSYILAHMAGHKPDKLPPGLTQNDISNAHFHMFTAPRPRPPNVPANERVTALSNAFQAYSAQLNRPIAFYGKAMDETGAPLIAATATIRCLVFHESQFTTNISTDVNGLFTLHGINGQALSVSVAKDGYEETPGTNEHHFAYYGIAKGFRSDPYKPIIFHLRKKE